MEEVKATKEKDDKVQQRLRAAASYAYNDLDDSLSVARRMQEMQGGSCTADQLAAWLDYKSTKSGTFQSRLSSAKQFGFVTGDNSSLLITERARSIFSPVMPEDATQAKVDAFLGVDLYGKIYERFKGTTIPPRVGLRNLLVNQYGLSADAADKAVRVMMESAAQAGMFPNGDDNRLVRPGVRASAPPVPPAVAAAPAPPQGQPAPTPSERPEPLVRHGGGGGDGGPPAGVHSAIVGLLRELPPAGSVWPKKSKDRFVKAFLATLDFVYQTDEEDSE